MASLLFLCLFLFFPHLYASSSGSYSCSNPEATSLIQFKNSFSNTQTVLPALYCDDFAGLKSYPKTNSWKEGTDCYSWDEVTCHHLNAHVTALNLSCSWLYGNFPSNTTLFLLPHLQKLNLAYNDFNYSKIPSEFGRFTSLFYLNLSYTSFVGQIPSLVSHLSKLISPGLVHNLTEVRHLFLDGIRISSINPHAFTNLSSSLRSLSLAYCDLQGKFPKNIFDLPNLNLLNLGNNQNLSLDHLKFNRSSNLEHLDLSWMSFSTEPIDSVDNLQALKYLDLSGNSFLQGLSVSITNLSSLEQLKISYANICGGLPDSMGNLVSLKFLDLSYSNLLGPVPRSLGNLLQLTDLDLSRNQLSGQIPRSLGNLLQLTHLDLSNNQLSGQIPLSILNLTQLEYLGIYENSLEGSIPDEVTVFPNLKYLYLYNNLLNGTLPSWLYTAPSLKEIHLAQNQFFSMFSNLSNLQFLDLSYNSLSLTSNSTFSVNHILPNLTSLLLSSCNLSEFPQFLKGLKSLEWLDLSYNRIEGKIPQWMQEVGIESLRYLNISHNSLTEVEQFPWKNIAFLDLSSNLIRGNLPILASTINIFLISNNSFNGEVSSLICNASALQILDLSHNNLSGKIPQCFGNLSNSLEFLNLKKNKDKLSNFNLNGNLLEGPLTPSILNCKGLEVLNLGNNKINDTFPHWLGGLPQLQVLVLKSNHMHGSLCVNSSKSSPFFSKIQIFDLSSNYFSGPLPVRYINSFKAIINLEKIGSTVSYMGENDHGGRGFYTHSIGIVIKGQYMELVKIFNMWMIIDLSNNQFEGGIPKVIGKLNLLKGLNLSHNNLNGGIPTSIGNLTSLEWLDLSSNRLSGTIPNRLAELPFLSSLNVSENQLHGNKGLCGFPVSKGCNIIEPPPPNVLEKDGSKSNFAFGWKMALIGYGCGVVFGIFVGYVVFQTGKPKWLVNLVENQHEKRRKRKSKKGNRSNR
ncbi:hypothetical protein ES332_A04G009500v1 [Gossypium tomentosum]|uniref:Leucine-rich repeat-containing N-terminal plant-type domain-containing protein n=1 Tax=Gossypium tomentosum TaxID=34277 RepID=A0A5D2QWS1_GOSTO|nr:hypothetical protein ES332_A04G009500v1 [Gossypium tomentosum]